MLRVCRWAIVAMALVTTTLLTGPAQAGMVATPKATAESKTETDMAFLRHAAVQAGLNGDQVVSMASMLPAEARAIAVAHVMAAGHSGNALGIVAVIAGVVVAGVIVLSEMLWDHGYLTGFMP